MSFRHRLVRWEAEFADRGLFVVEVSGGGLATLAESEQSLAKWQIRHPVLWDEGNRNHQNYDVQSWPTAYLIGADGNVCWQGNPERMSARPEESRNFRRLLEVQLTKVGSVTHSVPPTKAN